MPTPQEVKRAFAYLRSGPVHEHLMAERENIRNKLEGEPDPTRVHRLQGSAEVLRKLIDMIEAG